MCSWSIAGVFRLYCWQLVLVVRLEGHTAVGSFLLFQSLFSVHIFISVRPYFRTSLALIAYVSSYNLSILTQ